MKCPRRGEGPNWPGEDRWESDDTCSYCGSLNPDTLMSRIAVGDVELGPTDKSYKLYVTNMGGADFKMRYRKDCDCVFERGLSHEQIMAKVAACPHWVTQDRRETKFYFQHLSEEQCHRFIELMNQKKLRIGYPGHFYVMPFFCRRSGG